MMRKVAAPSRDGLDGMEEYNKQDKIDMMRKKAVPPWLRKQVKTIGVDLCPEDNHKIDMVRKVAATSRDSLDGMEEYNDHDIGGKQWIQKYMKKRECVMFIPDAKDTTMCQCGYEKSQHSKKNEGIKVDKWNEKDHTSTSPTDAFGVIDWGHRTSEYIRVDHKTEMKFMSQLLYQHWKLQKPKLIISVTGGSLNFNMQPKLKKDFKKGLLKAAETTSAFIITGGMHSGVMKHVGEAVMVHTIVNGTKKPIITLGIANWGRVDNKKCLINEGSTIRFSSGSKSEKPSETTIPIDPNHSHYILVDNGMQHNTVNCEQQSHHRDIDFRAELESKLSAGDIPIVCVVLEGGATTIETVKRALKKNTPTVIIQGSGRAADVLAFAYDKANEKNYSFNNIKKDVHKKIMKWENISTSIDSIVSGVEECLEKRDHMTIFRLDQSNSTKDLDLAMLQALQKKNVGKKLKQLQLALAWNRIDSAENEIFKEDANLKIEDLQEEMESAIMNDRVAFVKLFVEKGVQLEEYLTRERLLRLYNNTPENSLLYQLLKKKEGNDVNDVENLIMDLTGRLYHKLQGNILMSSSSAAAAGAAGAAVAAPAAAAVVVDEDKLIEPVCELFLWSVLMLRLDMAKYFWEEGNEGIAAALTAQGILKCLRCRTNDSEMIKKIDKQIKHYEDLAVDELSLCYMTNEKRTQQILVRERSLFGKATVVQLAVKADNKKFIAHAACQSKFNNIWMGQMTDTNSWRKLWLCMLLPFLILPLVKFHPKQTSPDTQARLTWYQQIVALYKAPVIKFFFHVMSDLAFIMIYSYVMLVMFTEDRMYPSNRIYFDPWEIVLIAWFASLLIEEIRQIIDIGTYFGDRRNFLDIAAMVMFLVGFTLRCIPPSTCSPCFTTARIFHALSLMTFIIRMVNMFTAYQELGPKLVMIRKMMIDMSFFVIILMVFVVAYGITTQAIMFPGSALSIELLRDIVHRPYFQIFGELFMETIQGDSCPDDPCPEETSRWLVPILLGVYILITHVLMINLLIAMFSYTFTMIHDRSDQHWHFQRYSLINEYYDRPTLVPPFIVLCHLVLIVRFFVQKCFKGCLHVPNVFSTELSEKETNETIIWENFLHQHMINKPSANINDRLDSVAKKLDHILRKLHNPAEGGPAANKKESLHNPNFRVDSFAENVDEILHVIQMMQYGSLQHDSSFFCEQLLENALDLDFEFDDERSVKLLARPARTKSLQF